MPRSDGSRQAMVRDGEPARYHAGVRTSTTLLVVHCTAGDDVEGAIAWMNRDHPQGEEQSMASYHYLVGKDGVVWRHCPQGLVAYHAGDSAWPLRTAGPRQGTSVNRHSLGIALANDNGTDADPGDDAITAEQYASFDWLVRLMLRLYALTPDQVRGHREVSPGRKYDPLPRILDMPAYRTSLVPAA